MIMVHKLILPQNLTDASRMNELEGKSKSLWQLRIAIDPDVLSKGNPAIATIKRILEQNLTEDRVDVKLYIIDDENDRLNMYDGMTSQSGLDRTEHGKEVCIVFNDTDAMPKLKDNMDPVDYLKSMILTLWRDLKNADIPLLNIDIPGEKKITGPGNFPTPFSITCNGSPEIIDGVEVFEWEKRHGILHKTFEGDGTNHPLLYINFTQQDLKDAGIEFNFKQIEHDRVAHDTAHQKQVHHRIAEDLQAVKNEDYYDTDYLFNDKVIDDIWNKIEAHQESLSKATSNTEIRTLKDSFSDTTNKDKDFNRLMNDYPRIPNKTFSPQKAVLDLQNLSSITKEDFYKFIKELQDNFPARVKDLYQDFLIPGSTEIKDEYKTIFKDCDLYDMCLRNPRMMQTIYRRVELSRIEESFIQEFKITCENIPKAEEMIEQAKKGLANYITRDRGFSSHLNFFSWLFDNKRGLNRAKIYQNALDNPEMSIDDKMRVLFALFDSQDGQTLQKDVAKALTNNANPDVDAVRNQVRDLTAQMHGFGKNPERLSDEFNQSVDEVLEIANSGEDVEAFKASPH